MLATAGRAAWDLKSIACFCRRPPSDGGHASWPQCPESTAVARRYCLQALPTDWAGLCNPWFLLVGATFLSGRVLAGAARVISSEIGTLAGPACRSSLTPVARPVAVRSCYHAFFSGCRGSLPLEFGTFCGLVCLAARSSTDPRTWGPRRFWIPYVLMATGDVPAVLCNCGAASGRCRPVPGERR